MKKRKKNAAVSAPPPASGPTLLEFWTALKNGAIVPASEPECAAERVSSGGLPGSGGGFAGGSGSGGGSGGGGYGLGLIVPDPASQERIRRIMRELCEQDAGRKKI